MIELIKTTPKKVKITGRIYIKGDKRVIKSKDELSFWLSRGFKVINNTDSSPKVIKNEPVDKPISIFVEDNVEVSGVAEVKSDEEDENLEDDDNIEESEEFSENDDSKSKRKRRKKKNSKKTTQDLKEE